jgi:hypothetical protein
MPRLLKILLIGFGLGFELIFVATCNPYPHGMSNQVSFRHAERSTAWLDSRQHPSPASEARFQDELRLMHEHEDWKIHTALGVLVVLNVAGIYLLLRYGSETKSA